MKSIKIPDELHKALKVRAAELGTSLQEITEEALKKGLEVLSPKPSSSLAKSGKEKQKDYRK